MELLDPKHCTSYKKPFLVICLQLLLLAHQATFWFGLNFLHKDFVQKTPTDATTITDFQAPRNNDSTDNRQAKLESRRPFS